MFAPWARTPRADVGPRRAFFRQAAGRVPLRGFGAEPGTAETGDSAGKRSEVYRKTMARIYRISPCSSLPYLSATSSRRIHALVFCPLNPAKIVSVELLPELNINVSGV
jgi:hypothetical protein